ncbi:Phycobilisome protein [Nostoc sp. DSM 114161]|jgi:hypothetical protein|uniref:hypothetical protein n=1 Tax=Nostoc sp. DSM 114161 TaxID=3440143 RepID=UPI004045C48D
MPTVKLSFKEYNPVIVNDALTLKQYWHNHLVQECPQQSATTRDSIVRWLLAKDLKRLELLQPKEIEVAKQAMEYRWKILHQRYLGISPEGAYRNLITRLGSLVSAHSQIQTWVVSSRARQSSFIDVLQHLIQELLQNDTYMQQQMACIAQLTNDKQLQNTLLFASIEEYALRSVRNQPLLVYCFVSYLRRNRCGGSTQVFGNKLPSGVSLAINPH